MKLLKLIPEKIIRENLNHIDEIIEKYSDKKVMYHASDIIIDKFNLEYVKGGNRAIYGWGIYFANQPFKSKDYGKYLMVVDRSNLELLYIDVKITDDFIKEIERKLSKIYYLWNIINNNEQFENLKNLSYFDFSSIIELKEFKKQQKEILYNTRNVKLYDELESIISNIDILLDIYEKITYPVKYEDEIISEMKKNIGEELNNFRQYFIRPRNDKDKAFSLFFKKCGYDGFNFRNYEYVIFNPDKLNILEVIRIKE